MREGMMFSLSGTLSSMGCGLPYSIAAQLAFPERQCIAFVGDGGFANLMSEFCTAVNIKLPIKVIILKDNSYGLVKWEQTKLLKNPIYGVEFSEIDFSQFANSCGGIGYSIREPKNEQPQYAKLL